MSSGSSDAIRHVSFLIVRASRGRVAADVRSPSRSARAAPDAARVERRRARRAARGDDPNRAQRRRTAADRSATASTGSAARPVGTAWPPGSKMPPLLLDDADVVAITASLLDRRRPAASPAWRRARARPRQARTGHAAGAATTGQRVARQRWSTSAPTPRRRSIDPDVLAVISAACRDHEMLRFDYRTHDSDTSDAGASSSRTASSAGAGAGTCSPTTRRRQDWRTYRVDRMTPNPPAGPRFRPDAHPSTMSPPTSPAARQPRRGTTTPP